MNAEDPIEPTPIAPNPETPWAVICPRHGQVFLTEQQYIDQMNAPDSLWLCLCGREAVWDDDNYEKHMDPPLPDPEP